MLRVPLAASASADARLSFDHAATTQKIVVLTFDADMTPGMLRELKSGKVASWYKEKVIEALRQQQTPATLFLTGLWIETIPPRRNSSRPIRYLSSAITATRTARFIRPATTFFQYRN
jgi:hypothetical protein